MTTHSFKLSPQGRIASAVSMALVLPFIATTAMAAGINAIGDTSVSQVGNVDVIDIAKPNGNGLSHNQYNDYNVGEAGAVLNNSLTNGTSKLAGSLSANQNLTDKTANVILNEVVSKNPSLLLGQQEVFGMAADYVLANPNGITCNGCGFINTDRASLVVGTPTIADERLAGFKIGDQQSNTLTLGGNVSGAQRLDLLAPKVDINGNVTSGDAITVISGRNNISYDGNEISALTGRQPNVVLDGKILGSMQSGRIRVHNSDAAATQTLQGSLTATDKLQAAAAGRLNVLGSDISANEVTLTGAKALKIAGVTNTTRTEAPTQEEKIADGVTLTHSGYVEDQAFKGSQIRGQQVNLSGQEVELTGTKVEGNTINAQGNNILVDGAVTTKTTSQTDRKSKGLWFNEDEEVTRQQDYQGSSLNAKERLNINADNDLTLAGADLRGQAVSLTAGGKLDAGAQVTENSQSTINRYEKETANLKTGSRDQTQAAAQLHKTNIQGSSVDMTSQGDQRLEGAVITADNASLSSGHDLSLLSAEQKDRQTDEASFKYWGGIGGGETNIHNQDQTHLVTTQINASNVTLKADHDVSIGASKISASNNADITAANRIDISHGYDSEHGYDEHRHGTAFNITDEKQATDRVKQRTTVSNVAGKNVSISADKVNIVGSQVAAADALNVAAKTSLTTGSANATDITETQTYGIDSGSNATQADASVKADGNIKGVTTITRDGTGVGTGNELSGQNVSLSGQQVSLQGSDIKAAQQAKVSGENVSIGAGEALINEHSVVTKRTGPDVYIEGGASGIKIGASIGTDQTIDQHHDYQAVDSRITAAKVDLSAKQALTNQGVAITAPQVTLSAQDIKNQASHDRSVDRHVVAGGQSALEAFASQSPLVGGNIKLSGTGTGTTTERKKAHVTQISADDKVFINAAGSAVDEGSAIRAKDISIKADDYEGTAAYDSTVTTVHAGNGNVSVDGNTTNFNDINLNVGGKGQYQYLQQGNATAVKGSLTADKVAISGGTRAVAAQDVSAQTYQISATKEARIGQNDDKQWKTQGGAILGGSVGATIIPATSAGTPSFSAQPGFNYLDVQDSQAQAANINAREVSVSADQLAQIDGATITANDISVTGKNANIAAAQDRHRAKGVSLEGNAALSLAIADNAVNSGSAGLGGDLGVINETSNRAHGANISTDSLKVVANDTDNALKVEGANIDADTVLLSNLGDISVAAASSKSNIGNFGIGANVSAGASKDKFDKGNVDTHLKVESDNSQYYELGNLQANNLSIESGNDITLQSNIAAGSLNAAAGNQVTVSSAQDKVSKVNIDTGLKVGGSPVVFNEDTSAEDVINAFKDDFVNGTILGVKASGNLGFLVDHQQVTHQATVNADQLDARAGNNAINVNAAQLQADSANVHGATINTSNNDDFIHTVGASIAVKTPNVSQIINDALAGDKIDSPISIEGTYQWDDTDGSNTKAKVKL